ncbi:MAG: ring-cleaving dioxygenase [Chloroflexaceae bacterium]|jgi:glyoxalase family protein|nr:ring-cleaving dioxygenase [Chloroflexaceae bacterium]
MEAKMLGLHHVTAIVDDPQVNVDFYTSVLGLRMIKKTVNFDDPSAYHLYYGDETGRPGTAITFFFWEGARRGTNGTGQTSSTAYAVPVGALGYWAERLKEFDLRFSDPQPRFGQQTLSFYDPAGLLIDLVEVPGVETLPAWTRGPVPVEFAIRGFAGVTLTLAQAAATVSLLTGTMGFREVGSEGNRSRYMVGEGVEAAFLDIIARPDVPRGTISAGSVHHVAWRVADDAQQEAWLSLLRRRGVQVTPVQDRQYFHSIYFREPGGVLFEIATDQPGFLIDEPVETLGTELKLPPWFEAQREQIESRLTPIRVPGQM